MITDISLSSKLQALALINQANGLKLTLANVDLTSPRTLVDPENPRDAELRVVAIPGTGYRGSVWVRYKRIDLSELIIEADRTLIFDANPSPSEILDRLNEELGSNLDSSDIESFTTPDELWTGYQVRLNAKGSSYAYKGSVDLFIKPSVYPLVTALTVNKLSGFVHYKQAVPETLSVSGEPLMDSTGQVLEFNAIV